MKIVFLCLALMPASVVADEVMVPAGTEVTVRLVENVSSCCNLTNALVMIEAEEAVVVDGQVVIQKGSPGYAVIRFSQRSPAQDQAKERLGPKVELAPYSLTAVDGATVTLHATSMVREKDAEYFPGEKNDIRTTGEPGYWVRGPLRARSGTRYKVRTLKKTAVDPTRTVPVPERDLSEPTLVAKLKPNSLITALVEPNETLRLTFKDSSPELLELYRVNDLFLPKPVYLTLEKKTKKKAVYELSRWTLIRYGQENKNTAYMRFRRHDGSFNYVKANYRLFFDWSQAEPVENNRKPRRRRHNATIPGQN